MSMKYLVATTAMVGLMAASAHAQEFTLRMHHFLPPQATVPAQVLDVWADSVEEASGGRIEVQRFPSMQLGGAPPQLIDQVIDGTVDIVWTLPGYTPGRFPRTEVFELPFMMSDAEAGSRAYWELAEQTMMDADFSDIHVLGTWVHGPGVIHSSDPVETVDDLAGVKLRAPTRVTNGMFASMGAAPVGMPVPAVPEALSQGVIDATVIPWEVTVPLRIAELVENHTVFGEDFLYNATFLFAMNQESYDALPDDLKQVIDDASGADFSAFAGRTMQEADGRGEELAEDQGNNIIYLDDTAIDGFRAAAQVTIDEWVAEMDAAGNDGTGLLEAARGLIAEHTGM